MELQSLEEPEFGRAKGLVRHRKQFILKTQETEFILSEVGSHEAGKQSNDMILFSVKIPLSVLPLILCCSDTRCQHWGKLSRRFLGLYVSLLQLPVNGDTENGSTNSSIDSTATD